MFRTALYEIYSKVHVYSSMRIREDGSQSTPERSVVM